MQPFNSLGKYWRYLRRNIQGASQVNNSVVMAWGFIAGLSVLAAASGGAGLALAVAGAAAGLHIAAFAGGRVYGTQSRVNGVSVSSQNKALVGHIVNTQKVLYRVTRKFNAAAKLPPRAQRRVNAYLEGMDARVRRVAAYDGPGMPALEVAFFRKFTDREGRQWEVPLARFPTLEGIQAEKGQRPPPTGAKPKGKKPLPPYLRVIK